MTIKKSTCRAALATLWFCAGGGLFILFVVESVLGRWQEKTNEAWGWFLPTLMPTLLLMIGVFAADATNPKEEDASVKSFTFFLSFGVSILYLSAVALTILLLPYAKAPFWVVMSQSNLFLGPFQGLVAGALGIFFVKARDAATVP
ncbi:MAG TPA: hypothetical protein VFE51_14080 [Verrucomicrobiae bacterium]|nr:hypothetical protein [Verrucomicrobiae bacterium]